MTPTLSLTSIRRADGTSVLAAAGEIDMSNADRFAEGLANVVAEARTNGAAVVVDLTAITYLDSGGLAALFAHADHIQVLATPLLDPVLTISGLADLAAVEVRTSDGG